jgi:hypothetical protein
LAYSSAPEIANVLAERRAELPAAQPPSMGNRGLIEVRCGSGRLVNAYVHGTFKGTNTQGQSLDLHFNYVSPGVYEYVVPVKKAPTLDEQRQNSRMKSALGVICSGSLGMTLTGASSASVCAALVEAPLAAAACAALILSYRGMCGLNTAITWVFSPVIDAFSDRVEVTAQVDHPTFGHKETKVTATAGSPIPTGVIDLGGYGGIGTITINPLDPGPSEGYEIRVGTVCVQSGSLLTVGVAGTDNFTTSTSVTISETVTEAVLTVPGGAQGIQDTITIQVGGSVPRTITKGVIF